MPETKETKEDTSDKGTKEQGEGEKETQQRKHEESTHAAKAGEQVQSPTEATQVEPSTAQQEAEQEAEAERRVPGLFVPLAELDVVRAVQLSISILTELAWQKMGLVMNPATQQIEKDMNQARLAIDTIALLVEQLKPHLMQPEYERHRTALTTLKLNFVQQSSKI